MKRSDFKKKINHSVKLFYRPILIGLLFVVFTITLFYKRPAQAASTRGKSAAAIIVGGGAGGGIAAAAGSAKWFPLGFGVGGLAGGLLYRHIRKSRQARRAQQGPYEPRASRRHKRRHRQVSPDEYQEEYQPFVPQRRHIRMKSDY